MMSLVARMYKDHIFLKVEKLKILIILSVMKDFKLG